MNETTRLLLAALLAALTLPACQPSFSAAEIETASNPPVGVTPIVRDDLLEVPEGVAIAIRVTPISGNATPYGPEDQIKLVSSNEGIVTTEPTPDGQVWVVAGVATGETCVELQINGKQEDCIETTVVSQ